MKFNSKVWSWLLLLSLYIAAMYAHPIFNNSTISKNSKETVGQACSLSSNSILNSSQSLLSNVKRSGFSINPYIIISNLRNGIDISWSLGLYINDKVFTVRQLTTMRLKYFLYPYNYQW